MTFYGLFVNRACSETNNLLHAVDVINNSQDIELSPLKPQNNPVLVFRKNIDGELTVLTEVRKKNGYLLVFDAWRKNGVGDVPML
jgi:hypothetical protein